MGIALAIVRVDVHEDRGDMANGGIESLEYALGAESLTQKFSNDRVFLDDGCKAASNLAEPWQFRSESILPWYKHCNCRRSTCASLRGGLGSWDRNIPKF